MPMLIRRSEVPSIESVVVDGVERSLGIVKDFHRQPILREFVPPEKGISLSWVHLDPGQELEVHQHPVASMIIVCEGQGQSLGDLEADLSAGDIFVVPGGHKHGFRGKGTSGLWALSVQFEPRSLYGDLDQPLVSFVEPGKSTALRLDEDNQKFLSQFADHRLFRRVQEGVFNDPAKRSCLLDCFKYWSDQFQRILFLRSALCEDPKYQRIAKLHLIEEFGHNDTFGSDRKGIRDPILETTSEWFVSKMLSMDNAERTVLVHLVLEGAATVGYPRLLPAVRNDASLGHFEAHTGPSSDAAGMVDDAHLRIGLEALGDVPAGDYERLSRVLHQAWEIWFMMIDRIAAICDVAKTGRDAP